MSVESGEACGWCTLDAPMHSMYTESCTDFPVSRADTSAKRGQRQIFHHSIHGGKIQNIHETWNFFFSPTCSFAISVLIFGMCRVVNEMQVSCGVLS